MKHSFALDRDVMDSRLRQVETADLSDVRIDSSSRRIELEFSFLGFSGGEGHDLVVAFTGVEDFHYHDDGSDAETFPFLVGRVSVNGEHRASGGKIRFHMDGEVEIEILCTQMQATQDGVTTTLAAPVQERILVPA